MGSDVTSQPRGWIMRIGKRLFILAVLVAFGGVLATVSSAETGQALIAGTSEDSPLTGQAILTDTSEGLRIVVDVSNAPTGWHGFHIHRFGSCADGGNAAGGHFNPDEVPHGELLRDGLTQAHAGDLGNLEIGEEGSGSFDRVYRGLSLSGGPYAVAGRAFILHASPDDFGQPTGNAGARIGCGLLAVPGP